MKTKFGNFAETSPSMCDLARAVLSNASTMIQSDERGTLYSTEGKLRLLADDIKHMQGQVKHRLKEATS